MAAGRSPRHVTRPPDDGNGHGNGHVAAVRSRTFEQLAGTPITIEGRTGITETVYVGKLSVDQLVALGHLVDDVRKRLSTEELRPIIAAAKDAAKDDDMAAENGLQFLTTVLDAETICALFGIAIDRPGDWVRVEVGAVDLLNIIDAVLEHNPWSQLVTAFKRAARRLQATSAPSGK
jgi:hypothetical protein